MSVTASNLYNYTQCPHRVWRDKNGPMDEKDPEINPFVEMLWEKGIQHEKDIVSRIGAYTDISEGSLGDRARATTEAMKRGDGLIYQGVLIVGDIMGIPDLLRKAGDSRYVPIDIKSGMGLEGADEDSGSEGKPKLHYALQLCLYRDALERLGYASGAWKGIILDIRGQEVPYDLDASQGARTPETWHDRYSREKENVRKLMSDETRNLPAISGTCKLCPWRASCKKWAEETDDLTLLFYMGRSVRDRIGDDLGVRTVRELSALDSAEVLAKKSRDKEFLKGIGDKSLNKAICRAMMMSTGGAPVAYEKLEFPVVRYELFFDIEDDPTQEFVYMHGVYERTPEGERYLDFTSKGATEEEEKAAWMGFWNYIRSLPEGDFSVYYYSAHEKTTYRRMQKKYPDVVTEEELEKFFASEKVIDLYSDVVFKKTDWPLGSYSVKALAMYLGFRWRDKSPSGALSIQWFNEYLKTKNESIMKRILEYNEDDCKAMMVLKDGLEKLPVK